MEIFNLLGRESKSFLLVILFEVVNMLYGLWLMLHGEDVLVDAVVHTLQHRVMFSILRCHWEVFLDTQNAVEIHVLCNLYGIRTPWSNHFTSWSDEVTVEPLALFKLCVAVKP